VEEQKHQLTVGELKDALANAPDSKAPVWVREWDEKTREERIRHAQSVAVSFPDGSVSIACD